MADLTRAVFSIQTFPLAIEFIAGPSVVNVTVRAFKTGFYGGELREAGELFAITSPFVFSPYWMMLVGMPPSDWAPYLEGAVDPEVVRDIIKVPTPAEAQRWADTRDFP